MIDWDNFDVEEDGKGSPILFYNVLKRFFNYEIEWKEINEKESTSTD